MRTVSGALVVMLALGGARRSAAESAIEQLKRTAGASADAGGIDAIAFTPMTQGPLAVAKDDPELRRYFEMLAELRKTYRPSFTAEELAQAQLALAAKAGLKVDDMNGVLAVAPDGNHWLNRLARGLREDMGVIVYWSPLHNRNGGHTASYDHRGWLMSDDVAPLLTKPNATFFHEFLHAYIDRGRHAEELDPLQTVFQTLGWGGFPYADRYPKVAYAHNAQFSAEEILTNLHTVYDRARTLAEQYGRDGSRWGGSPAASAPTEVQHLLEWIDVPVFLCEAVGEMAARLEPGVSRLAERGLEGARLRKDYGRMNGAIPYVGEVEENEAKDLGFFEATLGEGASAVEMKFLTIAKIRAEAPESRAFPVFFGSNGPSVRQELSLEAVSRLDFSQPAAQDMISRAAAAFSAPNLRALRALTEQLRPSIERLQALQGRGRERADPALLREIERESKAAFLQTVRFFTRPS